MQASEPKKIKCLGSPGAAAKRGAPGEPRRPTSPGPANSLVQATLVLRVPDKEGSICSIKH